MTIQPQLTVIIIMTDVIVIKKPANQIQAERMQ